MQIPTAYYLLTLENVPYVIYKGKGKVVSVHAMEAYRGSRCIPPLILYLGTRWR
jgi:hypothetical protein